MTSRKKAVSNYRKRAREQGGVIVYAMITSPEAIFAWHQMQLVYGSNRDAIEAAILDSYEQFKD